MKSFVLILILFIIVILVPAALCFAAEAAPDETNTGDSIKYIAAALAVGLCAIATGIAQARIGAAGMGSIVEKPETTGIVIICLAIPETMVILGFVVAAMIIIL